MLVRVRFTCYNYQGQTGERAHFNSIALRDKVQPQFLDELIQDGSGKTELAETRLSHIDGLRGVAALIVVIMHGWGVAAESRLPSHFVDLAIYQWLLAFDAGRIGVVAFFCISGYLIPFTMHGSRIAGLFFVRYPAQLTHFACLSHLYPTYDAGDLAGRRQAFRQPHDFVEPHHDSKTARQRIYLRRLLDARN